MWGSTIVPPGSTKVLPHSTIVPPDITIVVSSGSTLVLLVVVVLQYCTTVKNLHSNESKSDISAHEF